MEDLIKALNIMLKYVEDKNDISPTHCEHDILRVLGVDADDVSEEDLKELEKLGFEPESDTGIGGFYSFRFGSA